MTMQNKVNLTLIAPGLRAHDVPKASVGLTTLLARADRDAAEAESLDALLCGLFGVTDAELPVAGIAWTGEGGMQRDGWWLRADPVHISVNLQHLMMLGNRELALSREEADTFVAELSPLFAELGARLEAPHPKRWYLHLSAPLRMSTRPLAEVVEQNIDKYLPSGEDWRRWRAAFNEAQMQLHQSPVNQARQERGLLPVNSVWFWGGGAVPEVTCQRWRGVWSDNPLTVGLARLAGARLAGVPRNAGAWLDSGLGGGDYLVEVSDESLDRLERDWFAPLYKALRKGVLDTLTLYTGDGRRYTATRRALWRFWRRFDPN